MMATMYKSKYPMSGSSFAHQRQLYIQMCCILQFLTIYNKGQYPTFRAFLFVFYSSGRKELSCPLWAMDTTQCKKNGTSSWRSQVTLTDSHCTTDEGIKIIKTKFTWVYKLLMFSTNDLLYVWQSVWKHAITPTAKLQFRQSIYHLLASTKNEHLRRSISKLNLFKDFDH